MIRLLDDSSTQPKSDDSSTQPKSHDSSIQRFVYSTIHLLSQKQMKSIRTLIEQQQRRKAPKRTRKSSEFDDSLGLCTPELLDVLKRARKISVDGTFKVSPAAWTQCFVIGAFVNRRLTLCVHALLPGKQRKYYEEAFNEVKAVIAPNTPAHIISDFETATIRAMRETFPAAQLTGCLFHMSQAVFRKWREMGLAELYANDEEQGEGARNSFRVYVGLTAHEKEAGAVAFVPCTDQSRRSSISTNATEDAEYSRRNSFGSVNLDHVYGNNFIQFGVPSPVPSTPTTQSSTTVYVVPRWELPIVRPPLYPVHFWKSPSFVDIARSARVFPHKRRIKYILKEQLIGDALDEAEYNTDEDVMNILSLLSLQMQ
ncbi:hypothetical protein niasHT_002490 [Heterodera trifolii]|uniref:MULE transposase domain-containing protein n=1 Tax=Heterodera trifolii TaxID=157864 RepID=A0ABD2M7W7_9BILA